MSKPLRVLFQARRDILSSRGGDAIQLKATWKYLANRGVEVVFDPSPNCDCSNFDLVHLFNMTRPYETYLQLKNATRYAKPVCLSTIYWNMNDLWQESLATTPVWLSAARIGKRFAYWTKSIFNESTRDGYREQRIMSSSQSVKTLQSSIVENVDMLLPNSNAELDLLRHDFPVTRDKPSAIVHNCIDLQLFESPTSVKRDWGSAHGLGEFVVCAGRIEPRKNQVRLLRALSPSGPSVVLVGMVSSRAYLSEVRRNINFPSRILEQTDQMELCSIYAAARVHVLPSFYETPGLASLEAGAMGCNLVMSKIGCQQEYFADRVEYCDPYSENDIRLAVERAWARPWPNFELASYIRANFSWEVAARETHEAYMRLQSS